MEAEASGGAKATALADGARSPSGATTAPPRRRDLTTLRRAGYLVYAAFVVVVVAVWGVPEQREVLVGLVLALLALTCIGRGWRAVLRMLVDWLPFVAVLIAYDETRRLGGKLGVPVHIADMAHAEKWLFGGTDPTVWLQAHLHPTSTVHWYDAACTLVYTTHFVATPVLAAVLWLVAREAWLRFVTRVVVLSVAALITYMLFPAAPPWLASHDGYLGRVDRLSAQGWIWLHAGNLKALLARAQDKGSNPVAAMPSVHTALAILVAIAIGSTIASRWRWLLVLYPMAMAFTLVYAGEHYVLDVLAGVGYALATHFGVRAWERRRAAHGLGPFDFVPRALRERGQEGLPAT